MSWLSENPWPLSGACFGVALILLARVWMFQQGKDLYRAIGALGMAGLVLSVEWLWVTDRERIEAVIYDIADAVEDGDFERLESHLAPEFASDLSDGNLPGAITKAYLRGRLESMEFDFVHISNLQVSDPGQLTKRARADFTARAHWEQTTSTGSPDFNATPASGTGWTLGFREVEPDDWKVTRIELVRVGVAALQHLGRARDLHRLHVGVVEEHAVARLDLVAQEVARLVVAHALPVGFLVLLEVRERVDVGLALEQPVALLPRHGAPVYALDVREPRRPRP